MIVADNGIIEIHIDSWKRHITNTLKFTGRWQLNNIGQLRLEMSYDTLEGMWWWKKIVPDTVWVDEDCFYIYSKIKWGEINECGV